VLRMVLDKDHISIESRPQDWSWWTLLHRAARSDYSGPPVAVRIGKMDGAGIEDDHSEPGAAGTCRIDDIRVIGADRGSSE